MNARRSWCIVAAGCLIGVWFLPHEWRGLLLGLGVGYVLAVAMHVQLFEVTLAVSQLVQERAAQGRHHD